MREERDKKIKEIEDEIERMKNQDYSDSEQKLKKDRQSKYTEIEDAMKIMEEYKK